MNRFAEGLKRLPMLWVGLALILGIVLSAQLEFAARIWGIACLLCILLLFIELILAKRRKNRFMQPSQLPLPICLILLSLLLGAWRYQAVEPSFTPEDLAYYNDQGSFYIEGIITTDPQRLERSSRFVMTAEQLRLKNGKTIAVSGKVILQTTTGEWHYGEQIGVSGKLVTPPESDEFSYKDYLARDQVYSMVSFPQVNFLASGQGNPFKRWLYRTRQNLHRQIQAYLPQPEAALLSGILLGIETDIPADLELAFQRTGTAHIIAISGFNMTILAGIFLRRFRKFLPIWWAGLLAILAIAVYTLFVGAAPAVARAAVMSSLSMTGALIGRKQAGPFTLILTAAVMAFINPLLLWDAGFQLSVMATLGLVLYADPILTWFEGLISNWVAPGMVKRVSGPVGEYVLFTLAAQFTIFPVLLYHFERFSLSSFLANPIILPPQPLVMILGGIMVLIGLFFPPLAKLLSYLVWLLLAYTNQVVRWIAEMPYGEIGFGQVSVGMVLFLYLLIFGLTFKSKLRDGLQKSWKPAVILAILAASAALVWNVYLHRPDGQINLTMLGGQSGAVLVETPSGHRVLIDPGEHGNTLSAFLSKEASVFDRSLDLLILTDTKNSTYEALPLLMQRFEIGAVYWLGERPNTSRYQAMLEDAKAQAIPVSSLDEGMSFDCGDGVLIELVYVGVESSVLRISEGDFAALYVNGPLSESEIQDTPTAQVIYLTDPALLTNWQEKMPQMILVPRSDLNIPSLYPLEAFDFIKISSDGHKISVNTH